jgi:hypothetical protein
MKRLLSMSQAEQTGCWACAVALNKHAVAAIAAYMKGRIRNALLIVLPP